MILLQAALGASAIGLGLVPFLIMLAIGIGLFLLFRGFMLWYWKVDSIVKNHQETNRLLISLINTVERVKDEQRKDRCAGSHFIFFIPIVPISF